MTKTFSTSLPARLMVLAGVIVNTLGILDTVEGQAFDALRLALSLLALTVLLGACLPRTQPSCRL